LRKWKDNIKINFKERGWEGVEWIQFVRIGFSGGLLWTR
jgi:hypothetical protein